jgi:serine/threonine protein kinase/Flp pilus assembly protein TadD
VLPSGELGESLAAEMAAAWACGERLPAEHYLSHHPELQELPEAAVRLVYEEICLRQERGEEVTGEELAHRFPRWASELLVMLDCHRLVQTHLEPPPLPAVGESLGDFRLIAELGRGTHGRVFLATQPTLADRLVVLKVTPRQDREFLSLARLQHTHIIPLYGVHDFPARNLRALCQPYLGGATLARLLDALRSTSPARRTGRMLVDALDQAEASHSSVPPRGGGAEGVSERGPHAALARVPYAEAVCWIGVCLAEALHYAHERGLLHLDLKPSNVLLAADGQPMLLDFHLALHPIPLGQMAPEGLGGTPDYMSPEQHAACFAARQGLPVPAAVDRRSDVYSLGRLLYRVLGGEGPGDNSGLLPLQRCNPRVSVGLADIIHRCLAPDPARRYPHAAALAADLRHHLADLPLCGVPNRSWRERWRKWQRRRPFALVWVGLLLALLAVTATLGTAAGDRVREAQEALHEGQEQIQRRAYAEAIRTLARGKTRAEMVPGYHGLVGQLESWSQRAYRAKAAGELHNVTERLRLLVDTDALSGRDLRLLESHCRTAWETRHVVGDSTAPLEESVEEQARADLIDMALLWTDLKRRLSPGDEVWRSECRKVLAETQGLCGPSAALARVLQTLGGPAIPPGEPAPLTFREQAALGRSLLSSGELDRAARELERAVDLRPQDFWAHFYSGVCAHRRGRHAEAVSSFGVAVALAPELPEVYHNRALSHAAGGNFTAALRDYDRALALEPNLAAAALNRGVLHYQQGHYAEALADLERALRDGANPATAHCNLALVHLARGDRAAAEASVARVLDHAPGHPQARQLRDHLRGDR